MTTTATTFGVKVVTKWAVPSTNINASVWLGAVIFLLSLFSLISFLVWGTADPYHIIIHKCILRQSDERVCLELDHLEVDNLVSRLERISRSGNLAELKNERQRILQLLRNWNRPKGRRIEN